MGPILLKTTRGETTYALKLLPFGGSCSMLGEDEEEEGEGSFNSKSVGARMAVIAAGPLFNLLLAIFAVCHCNQLCRQRPRQGD